MNPSDKQKPLVIILAGPTGVGKSSVAALLCKGQGAGIIVSADSVQTYCGVNIGANKPTIQEQEQTPHLLIDIVNDPTQLYNAAEWRDDALFCIQQLTATTTNTATTTPRQVQLQQSILAAQQRQQASTTTTTINTTNTPIVVGGTMMYLQWLMEGIPDALKPTADITQRAIQTIDSFHNDFDQAAKYVAAIDPTIANQVAKLSGKDWYRLRRILEISYTSSSKEDQQLLFTGIKQGALSVDYDVRSFFLCPTDRMQHAVLIDQRCEDMLMSGLIQETTDLACDHKMPDMAARAIGYRQTLDYLSRQQATLQDTAALDQFILDFKTATRRYAKKQMQWFRKSSDFKFVPVMTNDTNKVEDTTKAITEMIQMSREDYELQTQLSEETKLVNEQQGKGMKFYIPKPHVLKQGSNTYNDLLEQADACTTRMKHLQQPTPIEEVHKVNES